MQIDEIFVKTSEMVQNFAVLYVVDIGQVPDFNTMYELYDKMTVMFFFLETDTSWSTSALETTTR